jgi:cell division protein FtsB
VEQPDSEREPRRGATFTSRALVLLLVIAVLGVSYASSIRAWLNQRSEQNSLAAQIADQEAQIAQLKHAASRWNDPAYIETQARLRFGWVMPGERSYRVIGKDGKVLSAGNDDLSSALPSSGAQPSPWWDGAVSSLARADATPQPKKPTQPARDPAKLIGPTPDRPTGQ